MKVTPNILTPLCSKALFVQKPESQDDNPSVRLVTNLKSVNKILDKVEHFEETQPPGNLLRSGGLGQGLSPDAAPPRLQGPDVNHLAPGQVQVHLPPQRMLRQLRLFKNLYRLLDQREGRILQKCRQHPHYRQEHL